jgi:hypothetical protein
VSFAPKIRQWKGGPLRLYHLNPRVDDDGDVFLERRYIGKPEMVPFGVGYALLQPPYEVSREEDPKVTVTFDLREGRLQCVAISSPPGGPELTQTVLRKLNIGKETREIAATSAARLELDGKGEVVAVLAASPREPSEAFTRSWDDTAAELGGRVRRPGRPPIGDAELEAVARIVRDAEHSKQPTIAAVATHLHLTVDAAKKRIRKARDRGLLPSSNRTEDSDG